MQNKIIANIVDQSDQARAFMHKFLRPEEQKEAMLKVVKSLANSKGLVEKVELLFESRKYWDYLEAIGDNIMAPLVTMLNVTEEFFTQYSCFGFRHGKASSVHSNVGFLLKNNDKKGIWKLGELYEELHGLFHVKKHLNYEWKLWAGRFNIHYGALTYFLEPRASRNEKLDIDKVYRDMNLICIMLLKRYSLEELKQQLN